MCVCVHVCMWHLKYSKYTFESEVPKNILLSSQRRFLCISPVSQNISILSILPFGYSLDQWFPTSFHLRISRQPISIICTLHISSATRRNVQLISQLLTRILSTLLTYAPFSAIIRFFFSAYPYMSWFVHQAGNHWPRLTCLTFRWPCIVINPYNKTNQMH